MSDVLYSTSAAALQDELIWHPLSLSLGSLALSSLICHTMYRTLDWRAQCLTVAADILTIGLDHLNDHRHSLAWARKNDSREVVTVFHQARFLLTSAFVVILVAFASCPPSTSFIAGSFILPALLWDIKIFEYTSTTPQARPKSFSIKRIPGMKALLVGIIRGYGTFATVRSIMEPSHELHPVDPWGPISLVAWSVINRMSHGNLADIRDFVEDKAKGVRTIPVLLDSVYYAKILLFATHILTILVFHRNIYIVFATLWAMFFAWYLNGDSPRRWYHFSFHSLSAGVAFYGATQVLTAAF